MNECRPEPEAHNNRWLDSPLPGKYLRRIVAMHLRGGWSVLKTVLIVEDNLLNMKLFSDLLQVAGYCVHQDTTGGSALAIAREYRPDLVLMDMRLPGASGLELTVQLKADPALRDVPVVAITASALPEDARRFREAGGDALLSKPIS